MTIATVISGATTEDKATAEQLINLYNGHLISGQEFEDAMSDLDVDYEFLRLGAFNRRNAVMV